MLDVQLRLFVSFAVELEFDIHRPPGRRARPRTVGGSKEVSNGNERIAELMYEKKGLNANVDFYSATVYYSLDIPTDLFTPIFAISRAAGWTAQVLEQLSDNRLYRPLTEYIGPEPPQPWIPMNAR